MNATKRILNGLAPQKVGGAYPAQAVISTAKRYYGNDRVVCLLGKQGFCFVPLIRPFGVSGRYLEAGSVQMFFKLLEQAASQTTPKPNPTPKLFSALPDSLNCALLTYQLSTTIFYLLT